MLPPEGLDEKQKTVVILGNESGIKEEMQRMYPYRPQTVGSFVECPLWGRGTLRRAEAQRRGSLGSTLPLPSLDGPPAGLFLPCHSFFLPACRACCPTPFLSPPALRIPPAEEIPPFALSPFWELWTGRGPAHSLQETASVKDPVTRGPSAMSRDLCHVPGWNSLLAFRTKWLSGPRSTIASSRFCQSLWMSTGYKTLCQAVGLWVLEWHFLSVPSC